MHYYSSSPAGRCQSYFSHSKKLILWNCLLCQKFLWWAWIQSKGRNGCSFLPHRKIGIFQFAPPRLCRNVISRIEGLGTVIMYRKLMACIKIGYCIETNTIVLEQAYSWRECIVLHHSFSKCSCVNSWERDDWITQKYTPWKYNKEMWLFPAKASTHWEPSVLFPSFLEIASLTAAECMQSDACIQ